LGSKAWYYYSMRGIKSKDGGKWKRVGLFFLLFIILCVLANSVRKVYNKREEAKQTLVRMETEVKDLANRQNFLAASLQRLNTAEGVAFEMRKKLNVAEAGESVAIIVEGNKDIPVQKAEISSWQKFKNFVVDLFR
jgi:cell division protein FtsB